MNFIGSDIISLNDSFNQKSFSRIEYQKKILTINELSVIEKYKKEAFLTYLFWTCKESAYKIELKMGLNRTFIPNSFEVFIIDEINHEKFKNIIGYVKSQENIHFFKSEFFTDYIFTIASTQKENLELIKSYVGVGKNSDHSNSAREKLKIALSSHFNESIGNFKLLKTEKGIPYVESLFNFTMPDISFSHDGNYFSYALLF